MPAFAFKTARKELRSTPRTGMAALGSRLAGIGSAVADAVAGILRGLMPAPALQPIPVRVRPRRRS
ncbi:hypothetical protein [Methylobacterium aerolatum]|uniref:Uncharacterized protein n=1 Tax=Methylobacterium aerolatum TaxID=418708 RepID=A0ABU0HWA2_9HYPH|nr:hypothetical protein [Methylobacterium aerolatum]MDQ0446614.1 hypothetical protein [Methylobacterium aerolatum]GJD33225.1 hypothetical protein FMGBMHLM_0111 [Methylobacterium aerolatum]